MKLKDKTVVIGDSCFAGEEGIIVDIQYNVERNKIVWVEFQTQQDRFWFYEWELKNVD